VPPRATFGGFGWPGEWSGVDEVLMWEVRHLPSTDHRSMIVDLRYLEFADAVVVRALLDACACLGECSDVFLEHAPRRV
jgi:hypothetical protein